ncbi:hypothetical protein [Leucobacter iarius]|uniref:Uncharacterized protein n=1 Tax=Leucobacter iarius TaxID=333963 RepID=A0ABP4XN61_9MICO
MYVDGVEGFRQRVQSKFGARAKYQCSYLSQGYVLFDLYGVFGFRFFVSEEPYDTLQVALELASNRVTNSLLGRELVFIENSERGVEEALNVVDWYCRLRLPEKYLAVCDELY